MDLSSNGFYGDLTIEPQNISSLGNTARYLNFSYNQLNGKFFSVDSIAVFKSLETLDLSHNQLSGELPPLNTLYNLKVFRGGNNQLFGLVPEGLLESSMQLVEVDLSGNGFTGKKSLFCILLFIKRLSLCHPSFCVIPLHKEKKNMH